MRKHEVFKIRKYRRIYDRDSGKFKINVRFQTKTEVTPRTIGVAEAFGLGVDEYKEQIIYDNATFTIGSKDIVYITGESGSGKSVLLRALENDLGAEAVNIDKVKLDPEKPIIETVGKSLNDALELLSRVGLNDAYLFVRRYSQLSDGQRYRYRIAKLLESDGQYWIMDEFCASLDRETAKIVAFNIQKQARRTGKAVIAATTHTDLLEDLAPAVYIHKGWGNHLTVKYYPDKPNTVCSVTQGLKIEEGTLKDYRQLAEFHYRNPKTHAVLLKIFVMKRSDGEPVGVIFYSWPPLNMFGRRKALGRRLSLEELNRKFATIRRVILHPKYRSIGLGANLVKETLPLVGREYVETAAVMARYNPFFEKAGMKKIAESHGDQTIHEAVKKLETLDFKAYALASEETNLNRLKALGTEELEKVEEILLNISEGYYKRLKASGKAYVSKKEFQEWIEKQDTCTLAKVLSRLAALAEQKVYLFWKNPSAVVSAP